MIGATFEAIALRWEGAAVADLGVDTSDLRERLETLSAAGVHVVLVGDGPPEETNRHLSAGPQGPGTLHLCSMQGTALLDVTDVRGGKAGAAPVDTTGPTSVRPLRALGAPDRMAAFLEDRGITGTLILIIDCTAGSATGSEGAGQRGLGEVFPRAYVDGDVWRTLLHSLAAVQFNHRLLAYVVFAAGLAVAVIAGRARHLPERVRALALPRSRSFIDSERSSGIERRRLSRAVTAKPTIWAMVIS